VLGQRKGEWGTWPATPSVIDEAVPSRWSPAVMSEDALVPKHRSKVR
jgi:hypothetical protein